MKRKLEETAEIEELPLKKQKVGGVEGVDDWNGINKRISKKVKEHIGKVIKEIIPEFADGINNIIMEFITPKLEPRPYWTPETNDEEDIEAKASKFGGTPILKKDEEWPKCGECENYMPLFVQLIVNDLPKEFKDKYLPKNDKDNNNDDDILWKDHVIQLFYCCNEDCDDGYEPFNHIHLQRVIPIGSDDQHKNNEYLEEIMGKIFEKSESGDIEWDNAEFKITGWNKAEKAEAATYSVHDDLKQIFGKDVYIDDENFDFGVTAFIEDNFLEEGDKLGGYPFFIDDSEFPKCCKEECNQKLSGFVFQTDAQILDFSWSDCGVGTILYCPKHPFTFGFQWQSS